MGSISNCGHDENGRYHGGSPGDQTGDEWTLKNWYSYPWNCVLRHSDPKVRATIAKLAYDAAKNDKIGYDQDTRTGYWNQLSANNYDASKISKACNADCSSGVSANVKAAGYLLNIDNLKSMPITSTHYLRSALKQRGFTCYTSSDYTGSSAKLVSGDILLNDGSHTATWVDENAGSASIGGTGSSGKTLASLGIGGYTYKDYTVKAGDTIQSIAAKYNCTPAMILFINNLTSTTLKAGTKLKIPTTKNTLKNPTSGTNPITKKHTSGVLVHHPVIEAQFYTEQGMLATVSTTGLTKDTDFDNDIISVNTIRNMSQDCPTFSINLVWRKDWYHALSSNDLVIIKMQRPPENKRTIFLGLIDDIRKVTDFSSGQPQRAVQVTGRGFNKAFVTFDVGLLENLSIDTGTGFFNDLINLSTCDSYDAIKLVLKNYVNRAVKYSFADGSSFGDHYNYTGNHHKGEILVDYENYTQYNGSLWNFIKELTNSPFNESFWEVQNNKATLIHRRTPFNKSDWIKLSRQTIQDLDIISDNTGRSDLETYTLYSVNPVLGSETMTNIFMPLWYPPFVLKYGITQLTANTAYQNWGGSSNSSTDGDFGEDDETNNDKNSSNSTNASTDDTTVAIKRFYEELFNFNIKNNVFTNGDISVKGKAGYTVGSRVIIESENMEYYVESVTQNFNCYGSWITQLGVTRGIEPEKRFTAPWGCAEEMTPAILNGIISQTSGEKVDWTNLPEVNYTIGGTASSSGNIVSSGSGKTITLPSGLGTVYTYMGWQCITAKSSNQYKLRAKAGQKFDNNGFGVIEGRYVIACTSTYGSIGDLLTVYLANGQSFNCIIGDEKNQNDSGCNKWGHQNGKSVIEFVVDKYSWYGTSKTVLKYHPEWKNTSTTKVVNTGHYSF